MKLSIEDTTLKEMADKIREKTQSTGKISVQDFAVQIKEIPTAEDLDTELNAQDTELLTQDSKIDEIFSALENVGKSEFNVKVDSTKISNNLVSGITKIMNIDTSKITSMTSFFSNFSSLQTIPLLDTSSVKDMNTMFSHCSSLETIPQLNTVNVINTYQMFYNCTSLKSVPELNFLNIVRIDGMFALCRELTDLGGFKDLGQAYLTTRAAGYSYYTLTLSNSIKLTHNSIMNVINNLYDIATKGCNAQKVILGSDNLNKLTEEEKALATVKRLDFKLERSKK